MKDQISQPRGVRTRISQIDAYAPVADNNGGYMNDFEPLVIEDDETGQGDLEYDRKRDDALTDAYDAKHSAEVAEVLKRTGIKGFDADGSPVECEYIPEEPSYRDIELDERNAIYDATRGGGPDDYGLAFQAAEQISVADAPDPFTPKQRDLNDSLFEQIGNIARPTAATNEPAAEPANLPPASLMVPENGSNGLDVPPIFKAIATQYGKSLSKEDVRRVLDGFRDELLVCKSGYDDQLAEIEAIGEASWTVEDMAQAGRIRRFYKQHRTKTEAIRKVLKEKSLRTSQLIDGSANALKDYCEVRETRSERIEKHLQIVEAAAREERKAVRLAEITPYLAENTPLTFDLGYMPDDQYGILLEGSKAAHAARQQAVRDAEREEAERFSRERGEREAAAKVLARANQLSGIGMTFRYADDAYFYGELFVTKEDFDLPDADFDVVVNNMRAAINSRKEAKAEHDQRAAEQAATDAENARIAQEQLDKIEADKAEESRKVREAALAPDTEKIEAVAIELENFTFPLVESDLAKLAINDARETLKSAARTLRGFSNNIQIKDRLNAEATAGAGRL